MSKRRAPASVAEPFLTPDVMSGATRERHESDPCPHVACPDDRCVFLDEDRLARLEARP